MQSSTIHTTSLMEKPSQRPLSDFSHVSAREPRRIWEHTVLHDNMCMFLKPEAAATGGALESCATDTSRGETFKTLYLLVIYRGGLCVGCAKVPAFLARGLLSATAITHSDGAARSLMCVPPAPTPQPATLGFSRSGDTGVEHSGRGAVRKSAFCRKLRFISAPL